MNSVPLRLCGVVVLCAAVGFAQSAGRANIPYADAKAVFDALRPELIPDALRSLTPAQREAAWPDWVSRRDADIRARLAAGDEDSVITFLLFGVSFTSQPRYSFATAPTVRAPDAVVADDGEVGCPDCSGWSPVQHAAKTVHQCSDRQGCQAAEQHTATVQISSAM